MPLRWKTPCVLTQRIRYLFDLCKSIFMPCTSDFLQTQRPKPQDNRTIFTSVHRAGPYKNAAFLGCRGQLSTQHCAVCKRKQFPLLPGSTRKHYKIFCLPYAFCVSRRTVTAAKITSPTHIVVTLWPNRSSSSSLCLPLQPFSLLASTQNNTKQQHKKTPKSGGYLTLALSEQIQKKQVL